MEEKIKYKILMPNLSDDDLTAFTNIVNSGWGDFFYLTENTLKKRLNTGGSFIGAYHNGKPAGILETIGLELDYSRNGIGEDSKILARNLCSQIPSYDELTDGGIWRSHPKYANTLVLVDITKDPECKDSSIASGIVDYSKA